MYTGVLVVRSCTNLRAAISGTSSESTYSGTFSRRRNDFKGDETHDNEKPECCSVISRNKDPFQAEYALHDFFLDQIYSIFRTTRSQ